MNALSWWGLAGWAVGPKGRVARLVARRTLTPVGLRDTCGPSRHGTVAKLVRHGTANPAFAGSNPAGASIPASSALR